MSGAIEFKGRVVIITGSSKGIGRALAEMFAAKGAKVVINGRSRGPVEEAVKELTAKGGKVMANIGDVSTEAGANDLVEQTIKRYGRIDVVVNNAGILNFSPFAGMPVATFKNILDVNLGSAFLVTRAAWPHLVKQGYGRVLMLASQGLFGTPMASHYATSKIAMVGLMRTLSLEGKEHGITVNAVLPFAFTEMLINSAKQDGPAAEEDKSGFSSVDPKKISPEMIYPPVAWLSHESCATTGEMLFVGANKVSRVFIAETPGFYDPKLSAESVRDNWSNICNEAGYNVPHDFQDSLVSAMRDAGLLSAA